ncbi:MAG: tRNA1(Val) (adenine(37)-N6)-methyltransferase [Alphaproteobacteria bacterium]
MATAEAITEDGLLGGRVRLCQFAVGYRVAIDPVFLAAAVPARAGERVLDVGAGVGAAALCLAARVPGCRVVGVECERELVRVAAENVALNGLSDRVEILTGDLARPPSRLAPSGFDHVMANPPHLDPHRAYASADPSNSAATVEEGPGLGEWVAFCFRMVRARGSVTLIHRADRLDDLISAVRTYGGEIVVFPLWPDGSRSKPAKRVILSARKGVLTPLKLAAGLVLHRPDGDYTQAAEAVLRTASPLSL